MRKRKPKWSGYSNRSKFSIGEEVKPHLIDVDSDSHTVNDILIIKEIRSAGYPKRTKYVMENSDYIWPESRLRKI